MNSDPNSYRDQLREMFSGGTSVEQTELRIAKMIMNGMTPAEAKIIDEAFNQAVVDIFTLLGERVDGLAEFIRAPALGYIVRGLLANVEQLDQIIIEENMKLAQALGMSIDTGGKPDCQCSVCTAARAVQGTQPQNQTRH